MAQRVTLVVACDNAYRESEPPPRQRSGRAPARSAAARQSRRQERQRGTVGSGAAGAVRRRPPRRRSDRAGERGSRPHGSSRRPRFAAGLRDATTTQFLTWRIRSHAHHVRYHHTGLRPPWRTRTRRGPSRGVRTTGRRSQSHESAKRPGAVVGLCSRYHHANWLKAVCVTWRMRSHIAAAARPAAAAYASYQKKSACASASYPGDESLRRSYPGDDAERERVAAAVAAVERAYQARREANRARDDSASSSRAASAGLKPADAEQPPPQPKPSRHRAPGRHRKTHRGDGADAERERVVATVAAVERAQEAR